ncbi:sideroflexin-5-like [Rhopilema esculentum]|uniref:sideroflexin-5-like n=1 Tax=Rhopilema esculentum TaxID=499914 RepID=UPI0031D29359
MAGEVPTFSLDGDQFDQRTYLGRLYRCFNLVDPRTLFTSKAQLQDALSLLESFRLGTLPKDVSDKQLWHARKIKEAIIHPDTGEKILLPFRMSGFVPFGTITVVGMLLPSPSLKQIIFWQWMNQSHNAFVNYANRNATKETPTSRFIQSYAGAVTSAVGIAVGLSLFIKRSTLSTNSKALVQRFVAYPATCMANLCNIFLMRQNELREGIEVEDENGNVVGTSKIAAWKAVQDTALTRIALPAPILIVPPIIMAFLERTKFLIARPRLNLPLNALVCTFSFGVTLPFAIALFPQRSKIAARRLEEEIQAKTASEDLYFNKGL